jgi:cold shock protein
LHIYNYFLILQTVYLKLFIFIFMKTGKVKFFIESKGFGFITEDETNEDFFVHVTGLNGLQIQQHDKVAFDTQEGKKGINALNVQRI